MNEKSLIKLLIEANVQWPEGAEFAAQDKDTLDCDFYKSMPERAKDSEYWADDVPSVCSINLPTLCHNWHQTVVTREQYESAETTPTLSQYLVERSVKQQSETLQGEEKYDVRDGWISWDGTGECPVDGDVLVDTLWEDYPNEIETDPAGTIGWDLEELSPIAYRVHKKEPINVEGQTIDQKILDWKNAQVKADELKCVAQEAQKIADQLCDKVQSALIESGWTK